MFLSALHNNSGVHSLSVLSLHETTNSCCHSNFLLFPSTVKSKYTGKRFVCISSSKNSDAKPDKNRSQSPSLKPKGRARQEKTEVPREEDKNSGRKFPTVISKKPKRGRRSEAAAVEDFVRDSLERTFESIRQQNSDILKDKVMKDKVDDGVDSNSNSDEDDDDRDEEKGDDSRGNEMMVEEENPNWPLDADVGWGIRASEYFEQHPIKNVVGEDGTEIDWEGEIDDGLVKEINCLEWESFAFHPSPLIVLVFERYNRSVKVLEKKESVKHDVVHLIYTCLDVIQICH
ncbi:Hypothetical predicted protein [Olea europaea subsp. europaea]|uniref:Uncharacterized protein n=1 Tax=Olea europaea subsp. europaea TaxID=158383 RepID=A0A8S0RF53_OLEEU|nr:Hypothetical predicted protein [Olea europaea subsp. europaea]